MSISSPTDPAPDQPRRRRRSSRSHSTKSDSGQKSPTSRRRKSRIRRLKNVWRRSRRFIPYILILVGIPALLGFGLYGLHQMSQNQAPPERTREERPQAWTNSGPRAFSLSNLTKMDLAGERSAYGRSLQVGQSTMPGKEILAQAAFSGKNYPEAELLYRELLSTERRKAPLRYHLFITLVFQNRRDEAEVLFPKDGKPSPAWFYSRAVLAFVDGDQAGAQQLLEEARLYFPALCDEYDPALRTLGFIP